MAYCMKYDVWHLVTCCIIIHAEGCAIGIFSKVPKVGAKCCQWFAVDGLASLNNSSQSFSHCPMGKKLQSIEPCTEFYMLSLP